MALAQREQAIFGRTYTPIERIVAGVIGLVGVVGHAALVAAAATLCYLLLVGL